MRHLWKNYKWTIVLFALALVQTWSMWVVPTKFCAAGMCLCWMNFGHSLGSDRLKARMTSLSNLFDELMKIAKHQNQTIGRLNSRKGSGLSRVDVSEVIQ